MPLDLPAPVTPPAAVSRSASAAEVVVLPFNAGDDSPVTWAVERFDETAGTMLLVLHPKPFGVCPTDLAELRARFASRFAGRYAVSARPMASPGPGLRFVRVPRSAG